MELQKQSKTHCQGRGHGVLSNGVLRHETRIFKLSFQSADYTPVADAYMQKHVLQMEQQIHEITAVWQIKLSRSYEAYWASHEVNYIFLTANINYNVTLTPQ